MFDGSISCLMLILSNNFGVPHQPAVYLVTKLVSTNWESYCRPKEEGSMSIGNLVSTNIAFNNWFHEEICFLCPLVLFFITEWMGSLLSLPFSKSLRIFISQ